MKHRAISIPLVSVYLTRIWVACILLIVISVIGYSTFLLMAVMHASIRQQAQSQISSLATQVGNQESQYLKETQEITPASVAQLGLVVPTAISTVYAAGEGPALSMRMGQ